MTSALVLGGSGSGKTTYVGSLIEATRAMQVKVWPANAETAQQLKEWELAGRPAGTLTTVDLQFWVGRVAHRSMPDRLIDWLFQPPAVKLHLQDTRGGDTEDAPNHAQDALKNIEPWAIEAHAIIWIIDPASLLDFRKGSVQDQGRFVLQLLKQHRRRGRRLAIVLSKRDFFVADGRLKDHLVSPEAWMREILGDFFLAFEACLGAPSIGVFAVSAWGGNSGGSDSRSAMPPANKAPAGVGESFAWAVDAALRRPQRVITGFISMLRERPARAALVGTVLGLLAPTLLLLMVCNIVSYASIPSCPSSQASDDDLVSASLEYDRQLLNSRSTHLLSLGEVSRRKGIVDEELDRRALADWQSLNAARPSTTTACIDHLVTLDRLLSGCRTEVGRKATTDVIESLRRQFRERFLDDYVREVAHDLQGKSRSEVAEAFGRTRPWLASVGEDTASRIVECHVAVADATFAEPDPASASRSAAGLIEHRDWIAATFRRQPVAKRYSDAKEACGQLLQKNVADLLSGSELDLVRVEEIAKLVGLHRELDLPPRHLDDLLLESVPRHEAVAWTKVDWKMAEASRFVRTYEAAWPLVPATKQSAHPIVRGVRKMTVGTPLRIVVTKIAIPDNSDPVGTIVLRVDGQETATLTVEEEPTIGLGKSVFAKPRTFLVPEWKVGSDVVVEVLDRDWFTAKESLILFSVDLRRPSSTHTAGQTTVEYEAHFDDEEVQRAADLVRP